MKSENAIEVNNVTKKFKVYFDKGHTLKEKTLFRKRRSYEERVVLNGISFAVKKGEAVGLIGYNGCGKSTTLKMLTKIMYPDSGTIEMRGRASSLLELGAGFHPDMSGRENIYINASIFGLTKKEIDARVADVIAFSELEEFIDNPVRTYSSGMYMRLAFAVAINVKADILLIDEILAVGDANFQAKCFEKLREIKAEGVTIVLVSHSLGQIEQICDKSIWLDGGQIKKCGTPREVHPAYLDHMGKKRKIRAEREAKSSKAKADIEEDSDKKTEESNSQGSRQVGNYDIKITHKWFADGKELERKQVMGTKHFGKLDWSRPVTAEKMQLDQATDYLIRVLDMLDDAYGLKGKSVADIGGSNISSELAAYYGIKKMVCIDPVTRWYSDLGYDIKNTRYADLALVTNEDFSAAWDSKSYFIVDEPAENLTEAYDNKFDIVVSMSTFEHVDSVEKTMNNIYHMLCPGGILFASYEPVFTCAKGHHVWINEELCFARLPELDFFHLKYTYDEAKEFLKGFEKFDGFVDTILEQAYHSHVINRKTFKQHIDEISRSRFNNYVIDYWYLDQEPELKEDLERIKQRFGEQRFDVRGIAVTAYKD